MRGHFGPLFYPEAAIQNKFSVFGATPERGVDDALTFLKRVNRHLGLVACLCYIVFHVLPIFLRMNSATFYLVLWYYRPGALLPTYG